MACPIKPSTHTHTHLAWEVFFFCDDWVGMLVSALQNLSAGTVEATASFSQRHHTLVCVCRRLHRYTHTPWSVCNYAVVDYHYTGLCLTMQWSPITHTFCRSRPAPPCPVVFLLSRLCERKAVALIEPYAITPPMASGAQQGVV